MSTQSFSVWSTRSGSPHQVTLTQPDAGSPDLGAKPSLPPGAIELRLADGRLLRTLGDGRYQDQASDEQFSTSPPDGE